MVLRVTRNYDFSEETAQKVGLLIKHPKDGLNHKKIKVIYLRAMYGYEADVIASMVGYTRGTVWHIQQQWMKYGPLIFEKKKNPGGRISSYISVEEEKRFLAQLEEKLGLKIIHDRYKEFIGINIALSTTYRMLNRHGYKWKDHIEKEVVNTAIKEPKLGCVKVSEELKKKGVIVSFVTVRSILIRRDLETFEKRFKALKDREESQ